MKRFWGQFIAVVVFAAAASVFLPEVMKANVWVQMGVALVVVALLGSGILAAIADVSKWPDRGIVLGTLWGIAGAYIASAIFGDAAWNDNSSLGAVGSLRLECIATGNAVPAGCRFDPQQFSNVTIGALVWPILIDLVVLSVGMAIIGLPILVIIRLLGGNRNSR